MASACCNSPILESRRRQSIAFAWLQSCSKSASCCGDRWAACSLLNGGVSLRFDTGLTKIKGTPARRAMRLIRRKFDFKMFDDVLTPCVVHVVGFQPALVVE